MNPPQPLPDRQATWKTTARRSVAGLLGVYWLSMFTGTHLPTIPQTLAEQGDKLLHLCGYAGLAVLLLAWCRSRSRGPVTLWTVLLVWLATAGYGVVDELTQPLVGRYCDLQDWIADAIGAGAGLAVAWPILARLPSWLRREPQPERPATTQAGEDVGQPSGS